MRLFFAFVPDNAARREVSNVGALLRCDPELRQASIAWVPDDQYHVTLAFLGEIPDPRVSELIEGVSSPLQQASVRVELDSVGVFPPRGPGRVMCMGPADWSRRSLTELHRSLWQRLCAREWGHPPKRYDPHVTLGRVRHSGGAVNLRSVAMRLATPPVAWTATQLILYESRLSRAGASYRVVTQVPLTGTS